MISSVNIKPGENFYKWQKIIHLFFSDYLSKCHWCHWAQHKCVQVNIVLTFSCRLHFCSTCVCCLPLEPMTFNAAWNLACLHIYLVTGHPFCSIDHFLYCVQLVVKVSFGISLLFPTNNIYQTSFWFEDPDFIERTNFKSHDPVCIPTTIWKLEIYKHAFNGYAFGPPYLEQKHVCMLRGSYLSHFRRLDLFELLK